MASDLNLAKKWLPILVVAVGVMYFVTGRILEADASSPAVRTFAMSNGRITQEVGLVQDVKIIKRVSVSATESTGAYRLYTVSVWGANSSTTVVIRLEGDRGDGPITLESIDRSK